MMAERSSPSFPKLHPGTDDPDEVPSIRQLDCTRYEACLDVADLADWPGFSCVGCPDYVSGEQLVEVRIGGDGYVYPAATE